MVRNVLEIMSFSKMSIYNDDTYAVRDLSDSKNFYMTEMRKDTFCGWLVKNKNSKTDDDKYFIEDCGKAGRIKHEEIDKIYGIDFASKFKKDTFGNKAKDKIAVKKYKLIGSDNFRHSFTHTATSTVGDKRYSYDKTSSLFGTLVLTGQPSGRDEKKKIPSGKVYEFVFFEGKNKLVVSKEVMENFLFAYFDKRTTQPKESLDWKYWKEKLENGEKVPVFFQKNTNGLAHFGLSYLYKLPYKHSVSAGIPSIHKENRKDLAETMFGYIGEKEALKGRVQFSHFKAVKNVKILKEVREILGTPRASYYPMYVKQNGKLFTTFMNNGFSISGRKRYPIHKNGVQKTTDTGNENVGTTFSPLKEGVVFQGKVRYHNLKKVELGALLSALTFHDTKGCFHNIGMAKSLGYGKVELKIDGIELEEFLKDFEKELTVSIPNWVESEQLTELLTMATEQDNHGNSKLNYMELDEFTSNKTGNKNYLQNYTELDKIKTVSVQSLVSTEELEELKEFQSQKEEEERQRVEAKERALKEVEEKEKQELLFNNELKVALVELEKEEGNLQVVQNFIDKYPNYEKIEEIKLKKETIEKEKKDNRHKEVNEKADRGYEALQKKKGNQKQYEKEKGKFVKKWSKEKENKGSEYILEMLEKLK